MSDPDPDRIARLERRVAELEARLTAMGAAPGPAIAATTSQPPSATAPKPSLWATGGAAVPPAQAVSAAGIAPDPGLQPASKSPNAPVPWDPSTVEAAMARPPGARSAPRSLAQLEEQLSSRLLAWIGGIALLLGALFFLSLAFSRGWIGPEGRVLIGLVAGAAALLAGTWLFGRGDRTPALVLTGVGVGTSSLALFAASRLFELIPVEFALIGFFVLALGTAAIALYANSQTVVAFGIVATTIAPPILGARPDLVTVAYLVAALIGTALISMRRSWPLLALLAFSATAPQAANWFQGETSTTLVIAGIGVFWAINALAASGSSLARLQPSVHLTSATLLTLNALFAIVSLHTYLPDDPLVRSAGLLVLASLHGGLAIVLLLRPPGRDPFGVLAAGIAAGTLAIGMAIELGGTAPPIGNAVLAVVVAWVAIRFREPAAAVLAAAIGSFSLVHLLALEYPLRQFSQTTPEGWAFASPEGIVAIVLAGAMLLVAGIAWRSFTMTPLGTEPWTANLALVAGCLGAIGVIGYATEFEMVPALVVVAWAILAGAAFGLAALVRRDRQSWAWNSAATGGAVLVVLAALAALGEVARPSRLLVDPDRVGAIVPLFNLDTIALAALAAVIAFSGQLVKRWSPPQSSPSLNDTWAAIATGTSGGLLLYLASIAIVDAFQTRVGAGGQAEEIATQAQVVLSIVWVLVGAGVFGAGLVYRMGLARVFGLGLLAVATAKVFVFDLASLDVAYRVLSFIGLGGVLLASSFVAARFRGQTGPPVEDR